MNESIINLNFSKKLTQDIFGYFTRLIFVIFRFFCRLHQLTRNSACHVVSGYPRGQASVYARLRYKSFQASESGNFVGVRRRVVEDRLFYLVIPLSLLLRLNTPALLQSACLLSADYSEELCSHRSTFHGLDLWYCRLRHIETYY